MLIFLKSHETPFWFYIISAENVIQATYNAELLHPIKCTFSGLKSPFGRWDNSDTPQRDFLYLLCDISVSKRPRVRH